MLASAGADAIVALRDTDGDDELTAHAERAAAHVARAFRGPPVAFGLCHPEAQAWFVSRLSAAPHREEVARDLSFDPVAQPARLSSSPSSPAEAKRVMARLIGQDVDLAALADEVFRNVPAEEFDASCGLRPFAEALRDEIVPVVVPGS